MRPVDHARATSPRFLAAAVLTIASTLTSAPAQWTVYYLNPPDQPGSGGEDTVGGQHVGYVRVGPSCYDGAPHAAIWEDTSADWIDLHPPDTVYSFANGTTGTQQAGSVIPEGSSWYHAALWSGTAESFLDLHPTGATESNAYAISGTQQVGSVKAGTPPHAALWEGTPQSHVDLNPAGSEFSVALDTNGQRQVGYMLYDYIYGDSHAALWSGTAESFVDLHPADGVENSAAFGISPDGNEQVGYVQVQVGEYVDYHAAIWHGSADEWVDLNPPGAIFSSARATDGTHQAGQAYAGEDTYYTYRAYFWAGSVDTRVDLHALLPSEYTMSEAESVYTDAAGIWVLGYAHRTGVQCDQAILWHLPSNLPGDLNCDGDVNAYDIDGFICALSAQCDYEGIYPDCDRQLADINGDGEVNAYDIDGFIALVGGG